MAARLRRVAPAFADRFPSGPAKSGFVPAVRVPTGEAPAVTGEVAVGTSSRSISLRGLPKPDPIPILGGTTPEAAAVPPGPAVPIARPPEPEGRPARRAARGLGWSGIASALLHLGVALPFLVVLPSRDMPPAGGDPETFAVEIVPAGDAEADRLARSGAVRAPEVAAVPQDGSAAIAATPPELSLPPDDVPEAGAADPIDRARTPTEAVPPGDPAAEPPSEFAASEPSGPAALPDPIATDTPPRASPDADPDVGPRPEASSEAPAVSPPEPPVPSSASEIDVAEPAHSAAAEPALPASERSDEAVATEGERTIEARADSAAVQQPARPDLPVATAPESAIRTAAPARSGTSPAPSDVPPQPASTGAARPGATSRPARADRRPARSKPPATAAAQPAPVSPRTTSSPPSRAGADRPDGGASAATTRAGAAAPRGDGQAGAEVLASYRNRVLAHLARHKQYPDSARDRGIEGRVAVTFTLSASGQVVAAALAGSSGRPELDRITLATVQRASPFPPIPPGGPTTMTFRTALRYDLR